MNIRDDAIREIYGVETFSFAGVGNWFCADTDLHFTFWDWHREPNGLIVRAAVKHGKCPAFNVPGISNDALTAVNADRIAERLRAHAS
jgi:hypothetical protein